MIDCLFSIPRTLVLSCYSGPPAWTDLPVIPLARHRTQPDIAGHRTQPDIARHKVSIHTGESICICRILYTYTYTTLYTLLREISHFRQLNYSRHCCLPAHFSFSFFLSKYFRNYFIDIGPDFYVFFYVLFFKPSQINRPAVKAWQEYFSQIHIYLSISWRKKSFSNIPLIQQIFKFLHFYSTFQTLNNSSSHLNSLFQSNFPSEFLREFPDSDLYFCHSDSVFDGWSP